MKPYQIRVNEVNVHLDVDGDQQCFHDIVLDGLVEIGPVVKSNIGNTATVLLVYDRQYNPRTSVSFRTHYIANMEREKLVQVWHEHLQATKPPTIITFDGSNGKTSIDITGLRAIMPSGEQDISLMFAGQDEEGITLRFDTREVRATVLEKLGDYLQRK